MSTDDQNKKPRDIGKPVGEHVRIFQREGSGIWHANYQFDGKQVRVSLKTKNKKQAIKEAMKLDIQLQEGTYQKKTETKSIADAVQHYKELHVNSLPTGTINKYTRILSKVLVVAEVQHDTKLNQLGLAFIDAYKYARAHGEKPVGKTTIHGEVMIIRGFVNWCLARKYLSEDPLADLHLPQPKAAEQPWWTWDVVQTILNATPKALQPAFAILAHTGMRYGELQWLTWDDIDYQHNNIHIRSKEGWKPKSKDQRVVPIMPSLLPYLRSLPTDSRWVVPMPLSQQQPVSGKQLTRNALLKRVKRVLKKLALKGHVHTFRHSFISYCVYRGIPEALIRTWVGHVDPKILSRYTHIHSRQSQAAMMDLSQIVKPSSPETGGDKKKTS